MEDKEFDALATKYEFYDFCEPMEKKQKHMWQMYSLQKVFDDDQPPSSFNGFSDIIKTPKLDGAAISLLFEGGFLTQATTRGDGVIGEDILEKMCLLVPTKININSTIQITGEVVCKKTEENARNLVSGALHLKDIEEFKTRVPKLHFVAYNVVPNMYDTYENDMTELYLRRFETVLNSQLEDFPQDGEVYRLNNNSAYGDLGFTAKHPRGAYARKLTSDVEIKEAELLEVIWQVGKSGKVTPVAIFENVVIDDANINRATLHNAGFLEDLDLSIGDILLITRSGGIIPKVLGKI
jgi:DNA ligase (NAD+)